MTGTELKRHLSGSFMLDGSDIGTLTLQLPCGKGGLGPIPSPWLLREDYVPQKAVGLVDCTITTLALKPDLALDLLLGMPLQLKDGLILADSMLFWSKLALFSLELVAREQFVPAIREGRSLWKPVLDDADQDRLSIFFSSIPPSCLASRSLQAARVSPSRLVKSFLDRAVDSLVRKSLNQTTLLPPRRGRKPRLVPLQQQFLLALTSEDPVLNASEEEIAAFAKKLDGWTSELQPKAVDAPFRTCFRLEAPAESDESWRLSFFLQSKEDRSLLVPASDVWRTKSGALTLLKKRLKNPQEQLLADLGRASRVFPDLEKSLDRARPTSLEMETEEAYSFLRQSAPLLEQNGFGVLLPSWWHRPETGLGIKLRLKDFPQKSGKVGPGFFSLDSIVEYDWQLSLGENELTEAEFAELSRLKVPLIQVRGQWMELRPQDIEAAIDFFRKKKDRKMTLAEALRLGLGQGLGSGSGPDLLGSATEAKSSLPVLGFAGRRQDQRDSRLSIRSRRPYGSRPDSRGFLRYIAALPAPRRLMADVPEPSRPGSLSGR